MQFFLYLLGIGYINDIIENVITDTLFDDLSCNTDWHSIFFDLLFVFLEGGRELLGAFFNEILYVFFYNYSSRQVGQLWPVGKVFELLSSQSVGVVVVSVFIYCIFLMGAQALDNC